jgi:predicted CXXCH cytochrome family protein
MEHYAYAGTNPYYGDHREPLPTTILNIWGNPYHMNSCGPCHSPSHHAGGASNENILSNQYAEWWQGDGTGFLYDDGHSDSLGVETSQGLMTGTVRGAPCAACHTVEGFITYFAQGDTGWALNQAEIDRIISETGDTDVDNPSPLPGPAALPQVSCVSCHSSHEPGSLIRQPFTRASLCVTCHNVRDLASDAGSGQTGTTDLEVPRHPQKELFEGFKSAANDGYRGVESLPGFTPTDSSHAGTDNIPDGCAGCHYLMVSDVAFDEYPFKATTGHGFKPRLENCLDSPGGCHETGDFYLSDGSAASYDDSTIASFDFTSIYYSGDFHPGMDYDGDGDVEPLTVEIEGMLGELKKRLRDRGIAFDSAQGLFDLTDMAARTATERAAAYNYDFVVEDGSFGYHNPIYVVNLLAASISAVP